MNGKEAFPKLIFGLHNNNLWGGFLQTQIWKMGHNERGRNDDDVDYD